jgi:ectoine hydroxylase-related dioxygenase (phytanoyl-CoA dioxygenase family)
VRPKLGADDRDLGPCHGHPLLADAATMVFGQDWHVSGLLLRAPLPGCGHQRLHPDFAECRTRGRWQTLSAMWCNSAFTADNGPLRVIPGSHRESQPPIDMSAFGSGLARTRMR